MNELICPLCRSPLSLNSKGIACINNHHFDRAREGYYNLLPVQQKKSKQPGDSKAQLQARRDFLSGGYFSPLADALVECLPHSTTRLLDIGCGDGYFTNLMCKHCASARAYAVDIAKSGIAFTAKFGTENLTALVASNINLPFADNSIDVITRVLAPSFDGEVKRVLDRGGLFLVGRPHGQHLIELRKQLYSDVRPYQTPVVPDGFRLEKEIEIAFDLSVSNAEQARNLLEMTPFAWRAAPEKIQQLTQNGWRDKAEFNISLYRKN